MEGKPVKDVKLGDIIRLKGDTRIWDHDEVLMIVAVVGEDHVHATTGDVIYLKDFSHGDRIVGNIIDKEQP